VCGGDVEDKYGLQRGEKRRREEGKRKSEMVV
jgi:hypothetical protein